MIDGLTTEEATLLKQAFASFDEAAGNMERSYQLLTARVQDLNVELEASNRALRHSLQANEEIKDHLHAIMESLATGVLVTDSDARITTVNRTAAVMLDVDRGALLGRSLPALLTEWGDPGAESGEVVRKTRRLAVTLTDLRGAEGETIGRIAQFHDVTELKRLAEQVQRQQRLAAMGEMAARLAHEIRSPLGSIELFGSLLRQELSGDPARRQLAEHICTAVRATDHLIGNTLSFVSPRRPKWEPVALSRLIEEAVLLATPLIETHRVRVRTEGVYEDARIRGDEGMVRQVVLNLILNAVQAMPEGGDLLIAVTDVGRESVRLSVTDTGKGIAPADRPRLFDPFFTTRPGGTGLGLAIAHNSVVAHGGWIEVESEVGKGSTFTVVLPKEKGEKRGHDARPAT
jgi:signal transduction histidine kinase